MFRDVPCSWFYRRPVGTYSRLLIHCVAGVKGVVVWGGGGLGGWGKKEKKEGGKKEREGLGRESPVVTPRHENVN